MLKSLLLGLALLLSLNRVVRAQTPPEFKPNDPGYNEPWAKQLNLPAAWAEINRIEATTEPLSPQVVVAILDYRVDCDQPDLKGQCLLTKDFTDDTTFLNGKNHGTVVASPIATKVNNAIGPSSIGGLTNRVKIISLKVFNRNGNLDLNCLKNAFSFIKELKARGMNIVVANCSFSGGGNLYADKIAELGAMGIYVIGASGDEGGINLDTYIYGQYPASFGNSIENVIGAASSGHNDALLTESNYGPKTVALAAYGYDVTVINTYDRLCCMNQ